MEAAPVELSRREREAVEAQRKKDHYMKLHAEGKTHEAQVNSEKIGLQACFFLCGCAALGQTNLQYDAIDPSGATCYAHCCSLSRKDVRETAGGSVFSIRSTSRKEQQASTHTHIYTHALISRALSVPPPLKVDMARLALVRKRREEAEARKAEEAAGAGSAAKEKMEKEAKAKAGGSGPQKLNPLEVRGEVESMIF